METGTATTTAMRAIDDRAVQGRLDAELGMAAVVTNPVVVKKAEAHVRKAGKACIKRKKPDGEEHEEGEQPPEL